MTVASGQRNLKDRITVSIIALESSTMSIFKPSPVRSALACLTVPVRCLYFLYFQPTDIGCKGQFSGNRRNKKAVASLLKARHRAENSGFDIKEVSDGVAEATSLAELALILPQLSCIRHKQDNAFVNGS